MGAEVRRLAKLDDCREFVLAALALAVAKTKEPLVPAEVYATIQRRLQDHDQRIIPLVLLVDGVPQMFFVLESLCTTFGTPVAVITLCSSLAAFHSRRKTAAALATVENLARLAGFKRVGFITRRNATRFARLVGPFGYRPAQTAFEKEL